MSETGRLILLNGAPRAGKSRTAAAIQSIDHHPWLNFGADVFIREILPPSLRPGIGLRPPIPGDSAVAERLGPIVPELYEAFHGAIRALCDGGLNIVADVGYHACFADPAASARLRFHGLHVLFVGVHCPVETIMQRRNAGHPGREGEYVTGAGSEVPEPVRRWQEEVHRDRSYDVVVDTHQMTPEECAAAILERYRSGFRSRLFD